MTWSVHHGDCLDMLRELEDASVDAVVTDPPYGLGKPPPIAELMRLWVADEDHGLLAPSGGFMGRAWDAMVPHPRIWREVCRVLKPGGHVVCFAGQRTADLMGVALRFGGLELRDLGEWLFWSGFPKSLDVSKAIDAAAGAERPVVGRHPNPAGNKAGTVALNMSVHGMPAEVALTAPATPEAAQWSGWGTALKPAAEPWWLARKPLGGTVAATVLEHGTGALNIDATRYAYGDPAWPGPGSRWGTRDNKAGSGVGSGSGAEIYGARAAVFGEENSRGRWPANVYYCPKASRSEREAGLAEAGIEPVAGHDAIDRAEGSAGLNNPRAGAGRTASEVRNTHPTVKPIALMSWLVRLVTPPGGLVVDPFTGSGTTGIAAATQGFRFLGAELDARHVSIARARIDYHTKGFRDEAMRGGSVSASALPLFGGA